MKKVDTVLKNAVLSVIIRSNKLFTKKTTPVAVPVAVAVPAAFSLSGFKNESATMMLNGIEVDKCYKRYIGELCEKYGNIRRISIVTFKRGPNVGKPTGWVFVDYDYRNDMLRAIKALHMSRFGYMIITALEPKPSE